MFIRPTTRGSTIARQQDRVVRSGVCVCVCHTFCQVWDITLSAMITPTSNGITIAPEQDRVAWRIYETLTRVVTTAIQGTPAFIRVTTTV